MTSAVEAYPVLHRYFLQAMVNRRHFLNEMDAGRTEEPACWTYLLLWYGCLFVVVEGWVAEGLDDPQVSAVLADRDKLDLLRRCRNAVFHYSATYLDPRVRVLTDEQGFVEWVHSLYDQMSAYFLAPA